MKARQGVRYGALEDLAVMDPATMKQVPADGATLGEVMFRGNIVMKGYLKNPSANEEAFEGGWFHSGDLGVIHPDGYIQLKDRSKDIIISGGENISSIEVEERLYKHPAVQAAAVVAVPTRNGARRPAPSSSSDPAHPLRRRISSPGAATGWRSSNVPVTSFSWKFRKLRRERFRNSSLGRSPGKECRETRHHRQLARHRG